MGKKNLYLDFVSCAVTEAFYVTTGERFEGAMGIGHSSC